MEAPLTPALQTVKPDQILHELSQLWNNTAKPEPGTSDEEPAGSLRACAMTLIVFVDDEEDSKALDETLQSVMRAHPSRAIIVRLKDDSGTLKARAFAQCWMPVGHHRQVCCEEVELSVSMDRLADLPAVILPLEAPDVPRVLWFRSPRIETAPDIGDLLALGDKIIVDSERPGAPTFADLRVLAQAGFIVADLAWTRLTKIRELLAQLLGDNDFTDIGNLTIEFAGSQPSSRARYLQAWLRSAMPGAAVNLHHVGQAGRGEIKAIRSDPDLNIELKATCAEYVIGSMHQRANLPACADHDLLHEELNIMEHDPVFERALQRMTVWTPRS
jgi:glucose-6-phosphate dehydrogenase assembly protein OpcA